MAWTAPTTAAAAAAMPALSWSRSFSNELFPDAMKNNKNQTLPSMRKMHSRELKMNSSVKAVLKTPNFRPRKAEELQEMFGKQGLTFKAVGNEALAEMKLENGCRAAVLVSRARVTSYKAHMWHRGEEEFLYTKRREDKKTGFISSIRGGIELRFNHTQDPLSSIFSPAEENWNVEEVLCDPMRYAQITLTNSSTFNLGMKNPVEGSLKFKYVITLSNRAIATALIVVNTGSPTVEFTGSIASHIDVSYVESCFVTGVKGIGYRCLTPPPPPVKEGESNFWTNFWSPKVVDTRQESPPPDTNGNANLGLELERGRWIVEVDDTGPIYDGDDRLYPTPPSTFTFLDKGFRRALKIERNGFDEFFLTSPLKSLKKTDKDNFICMGPGQTFQPVRLKENEEWRAAQVIYNTGYGGEERDNI